MADFQLQLQALLGLQDIRVTQSDRIGIEEQIRPISRVRPGRACILLFTDRRWTQACADRGHAVQRQGELPIVMCHWIAFHVLSCAGEIIPTTVLLRWMTLRL